MNREQNTLSVLYSVNVVFMILVAFPALACFAWTIDGWFPPSYHHPDGWNDSLNQKELYFFSASSILLIIFYAYSFWGLRMSNKSDYNKGKSMKLFILVLTTNLAASALFLSFIGIDNIIEIIQTQNIFFSSILFAPFIPIIISLIGIYENQKTKNIIL
jgi:hypothetical protein